MKDLLFEIGAEEIPASYIQPALQQMAAAAEAFFKEARLGHGEIRCEGTPRRLALMVKALQERQEDRHEESPGPSVKIAYDAEGKPTQVALGFAKGKGVDVADLQVKSSPKGDVVVAKVFQAGEYSVDLLESWLPNLARRINFPKSMRWAEGAPLRFARPISWLCAFFGERALKVDLDGIKSGRHTFGHRFLSPKPIPLKQAGEYEKKLKKAHVVLSSQARMTQIHKDLAAAAKKVGAVIPDEELVAITANLVEEPSVLLCHIDPKYLALPESVIIKSMREHQFCFAVRDREGKLAPAFLVVTNGCRQNLEEIREGNAMVIRARLEDASFFFREDQKVSLEARLPELRQVLWQEQLGSMAERVERLEKLAAWLAERLAPSEKDSAVRAARLCKSDLVTLMVGEKEYASLQGVMGGLYARLGGESDAVADAISEHYRPRFAGDAVPATRAGQIVALADKMDELAGCFGVGLIPTGSQDPYALRRKAAGIVAILRAQDKDLSFESLAQFSLGLYAAKLPSGAPQILSQLKDFFRQRLENALVEAGHAPDLVVATLSRRHDLVREAMARALCLSRARGRDDWELAAQAFSRINNILSKQTEPPRALQANLLADGAERILHDRFLACRPQVERACQSGDFDLAFAQLANLRSAIDAYFADVMVMAEDPMLRQNRLSFLSQMSQTLNLIADFTKLVK
jgi:glycyl-tRNA synthetase beta chain